MAQIESRNQNTQRETKKIESPDKSASGGRKVYAPNCENICISRS